MMEGRRKVDLAYRSITGMYPGPGARRYHAYVDKRISTF